MMPTNDDITKNKTLTSKEKADIQQFFIVIVNEMKKHGVPDIGLIKRAFEIALEKLENHIFFILCKLPRFLRIVDMKAI